MRLASLVSVFALVVLLQPARAADKENKLPDEVQAVLDKADEVEVLSLDPDKPKDKPKDDFHGYKVLGKTTVKKDDKKAVVEAICKGIADSGLKTALCFNPRHGLRATHDGKTVELVICFECLFVEVFPGDRCSNVRTTSTPQKVFDKVLTDAKVPLPGKKEEKK